jgi:histone-lysine N-methyltransferase MLL3
MMAMQVPNQQQPQLPIGSISGPQMGIQQQSQTVVQQGTNEPHSAIRPGLASTAGTSTPPPPMNNAPAPPAPPENPQTEEDRIKVARYEQWLEQQEASINNQLKYYETEIAKLRKQKKSLNSKKRTR